MIHFVILRRIASALKRQDWYSVAIEFALVVAGVLVALQINTWAHMREEYRLTVDLLGEQQVR